MAEPSPPSIAAAAKNINFFISRTGADAAWAQWIAWQLEANGYTVVLQDWDFAPGVNFVSKMHEAASQAERTIAVMSRRYFESKFTEAEWTAAFACESGGEESRLLPVRVENFAPPGLFSPLKCLDLFDVDADLARQRLLEWIARTRGQRTKPDREPDFPGLSRPIYRGPSLEPHFPGLKPAVVGPTQRDQLRKRARTWTAWANEHDGVLLRAATLLATALCAVGVLLYTLNSAAVLLRSVYFIILIALSICASMICRPLIEWWSPERANQRLRRMSLACSVGLFLTTFAIGTVLAPSQDTVALTVYLFGPGGHTDLIANGEVDIRVRDYYRSTHVGPERSAIFRGIPRSYATKDSLEVDARVPDFRLVQQHTAMKFPTDGVLYIPMQPVPPVCEVVGVLLGTDGGPVQHARLRVLEPPSESETGSQGEFRMRIKAKCGSTVYLLGSLDSKPIYQSSVALPEQGNVLRLSTLR